MSELWLRDVETIKVFADSLRLRIVKRMEEPITVKQVAEELDIPAAKLYYHINLLQKHGLIQVVGHNLETGIVEKIYQVTARQFKLVNPLIAGAEFPAEAASALFGNMLAETAEDFLYALTQRDATEGEPPRHPFLSKKAFRLTDAQLTALHGQLDALIQQVTALGAENADLDEPQFELTLVFYKK
ncbi:MAG: helix-turn-helix domain-containing protein [Caldilineaceae bacterium]|nr:helix-turn-helix domain-containing protein [Caldilineaceae bacterium]